MHIILMGSMTLTEKLSQIPTFLFTWPVLWLIALIGMFAHYVKKNVRGETLTDINQYFKDHFKSTLLASIYTTVAFFAYFIAHTTGSLFDILTVFLIGYTIDSLVNKWDVADSMKFVVVPNGEKQPPSSPFVKGESESGGQPQSAELK